MSKEGTALVSLSLDGEDIINLCGIQPLFCDEYGYINYSHLIYSTRIYNGKQQATNNLLSDQVIAFRKRTGKENSVITDNLLTKGELKRKVLEAIYDNAKHLNHTKSLKELKKTNLQYLLGFQMEYIRLCTFGTKGNFIMSSNSTLFPKMWFPPNSRVFRIRIPDYILPEDKFIVGIRPSCVYSCPLVACPIIPKEKFDEFCYEHGFDLSIIKFEKTKKYPLVNQQLDWYELYKLYLENVGVEKWYLEVFTDFDDLKDRYTVIHLSE